MVGPIVPVVYGETDVVTASSCHGGTNVYYQFPSWLRGKTMLFIAGYCHSGINVVSLSDFFCFFWQEESLLFTVCSCS